MATSCARRGCKRTTTHPGGHCQDHRGGMPGARSAPLVGAPPPPPGAGAAPRALTARGAELVALKTPVREMPTKNELPGELLEAGGPDYRGGSKHFDIRGDRTDVYHARLAEVGPEAFLRPSVTRDQVAAAKAAGWDVGTHSYWARWGIDVETALAYQRCGVAKPHQVYDVTRLTQPTITPEHIEAMDLPRDHFGTPHSGYHSSGVLAEAERKAIAAGAGEDLMSSAELFAAGWTYDQVPALRAAGLVADDVALHRAAGLGAQETIDSLAAGVPASWAAAGR